MQKKAAITGWGAYVPNKILANKDLETMVDTTDEWILSRTGIRERRVVSAGETTATMCTLAAQQALERAGIAAHDLDLIICATITPDYLLPATGCLVQRKLGADRAGSFDLGAACSGFIYGLTVGSQFIQAGTYKRVLVVAGETLSRFVDWHDRNTCVLFGDGAAAVILEETSADGGILSTVLNSRGDIDQLLVIEAGGCAMPASPDTLADKAHFIRMRGNDVFKLAVRTMTQASLQAIAAAGLTLNDIRMVIPHQANLRIITATQEALGVPDERIFVNVDRYGNTGAASVPIALVEYLDQKTIRPGDNILMVSFGGGLTWGAVVVRWTGEEEREKGRKGEGET